jgi:TonB family protein
MTKKVFSVVLGAGLALLFHFWKGIPVESLTSDLVVADSLSTEEEVNAALQNVLPLETEMKEEVVPPSRPQAICFLPPRVISCGEVVENDDHSMFTWVETRESIVACGPLVRNELSPGDTIFESLDISRIPAFSGDTTGNLFNQYVAENINWPTLNVDIRGAVICEGVVNRQGRLVNVKVLRSLHPDFDREALRILENMPDWLPARRNGRYVSARVLFPIRFKFPDSTLYEPIYPALELERLPEINDTIKEWALDLTFPTDDRCIPHSVFAFELVVEKDGSVRYQRLLKQPGCDLTAHYIEHMCRMPRYPNPGLKNGVPVRSKVSFHMRRCFRE